MQIQLTAEQARALKEVAAERGVSAAEIVRQSLDAFLRTHAGPTRDEVRRRAVGAVGALKGGPPDLSTEHDRYVSEAFGR